MADDATCTLVSEDVWGRERVYVYNVVGGSSYPAGGYKTSLPVPIKGAYAMEEVASTGTVASSILYAAKLDVATPNAVAVRFVVMAGAEASGSVTTIGFRLRFHVR